MVSRISLLSLAAVRTDLLFMSAQAANLFPILGKTIEELSRLLIRLTMIYVCFEWKQSLVNLNNWPNFHLRFGKTREAEFFVRNSTYLEILKIINRLVAGHNLPNYRESSSFTSVGLG